MIKKVLKYALLLLFVFFPSIQVNAINGHEKMIQQLNQLIKNDPDLQGAIAGVSIRTASSGEIIYQHQGDVRLRPASNMKLLTAAAALNVLGENYTFTTEVLADSQVKKKTLKGNLYLKGKGDPTLLKSDFDTFATAIKQLGIKKIKGNLVVDDSWYDDVRYSLDLPWSDETTYYGAQISALTASPSTDYDAGSVEVEVKPGKSEGNKVKVEITPKTEYVKIINHAVTVGEKGKKDITIEREHAKNTIIIKGTLPLKSKAKKEWVGVWEPTRYAAALFKQSLLEQGIQVSGKIIIGVVPNNARTLAAHQSMPLSELLVPFMKLSNNVHAEVLIKEMGRVVKGEGSWEKGLEVLETEVTKFGLNTKTMVLRDGSGVSHVDLIPASQISQLLFAVQKEDWFPVYFYSLPVAGVNGKLEGGSLRNRMRNLTVQGKVKAKTGTLSTVTSLSGYVNTKSEQTLIFSILLNNLLDEEKGKMIEDKMVMVLASQ